MKPLFPIEKENAIEKCKKYLDKYAHPMQIGTGLLFSAVGMGITAAGVMYSDGISFVVHSASQLPSDLLSGSDFGSAIDYVRSSYRGSVENAIDIGWRPAPLYYCIGHYCGGRMRKGFSDIRRILDGGR